MKTVTLVFVAPQKKTFPIPKEGKWAKFFRIYMKDDEDRTDEEWEFMDNINLNDFIEEQVGYPVDYVAIYDIN